MSLWTRWVSPVATGNDRFDLSGDDRRLYDLGFFSRIQADAQPPAYPRAQRRADSDCKKPGVGHVPSP